MAMTASTINQGSPFHYSSPYSLLRGNGGQTPNQQVPRSPGLSPFGLGGRQVAKRSVPSPSAGSPGAVPMVPDTGGAYSGSPLLRQLLRVGRKRQRESSPSSPLATSPRSMSKKLRESAQVPNCVIVTSRQQAAQRKTSPFHVVPGGSSPGGLVVVVHEQMSQQGCGNEDDVLKRQLPGKNSANVKTLELFSGDDIFAHEE